MATNDVTNKRGRPVDMIRDLEKIDQRGQNERPAAGGKQTIALASFHTGTIDGMFCLRLEAVAILMHNIALCFKDKEGA